MTSRGSLARGLCSLLVASLALAACGGPTTSSSAPVAVVTASPVPPSPAPSPTPTPSPTPSPTPLPSPSGPIVDPLVADLTGVTTDAAHAHRLPIAVLIDDNRVARPQSGFNATSVVYQAPADGGETRYMLVFQEADSPQVGPVRSGRIYFVKWASESKAAVAHYGGDRVSRAYLASHDGDYFTNVDALGKGAHAFHRIASRRAPHNGYTSTVALRVMIRKLGGPATEPPELEQRSFIPTSDPATLPGSQRIRVPYQTGLVEYRFDRNSDLYRRLLDGKPQVDPADDRTVTTRNVVVLFMPFHLDSTIEKGHARPVIGSLGTGRALVFREGRVIEGTWSKPNGNALTKLLDKTGHEIPLVVGRTFFQIVPVATKVIVGR